MKTTVLMLTAKPWWGTQLLCAFNKEGVWLQSVANAAAWEWCPILRLTDWLKDLESFSWRKVSRLELLVTTGYQRKHFERLKKENAIDSDGTGTVFIVELP